MAKTGTLPAAPKRTDPTVGIAAARRARAQDPVDKGVFDPLTRLLSALLDAPASLLLIADGDDLVFASYAGSEERWESGRVSPLAGAYCRLAIGDRSPFVVENALTDPRVSDLPATTELGVVGFLGVPLLTSAGEPIGLLCALDLKPRAWTGRDIAVVQELASTVMAFVESRPLRPESGGKGGLNIAAVSRKTGIAPDTLRKWERRYGVLHPKRTPGGQRRYDDGDVARVEWLRDRLADGFRISEAAALLDPASDRAHGSLEELRDALVDAARTADPARIVALVEQAFSLHPVEDAIESIVQPALALVGAEWSTRRGAIAEEHLLSETARGRLERMLADHRPGVRGSVVLACAPGERHDLGLLALGVMLQADGWLVAYLGADTPLDAVVEIVRRVGAKAICLSVSSAVESTGLPAALAEAGLPSSVRVVVGGSGVPDGQGLRSAVTGLRR